MHAKRTGIVSDSDTNEILSNAKVLLFDENMNLIYETTTSDKGVYFFKIQCNKKKYIIRVTKEEYTTTEKTITSNSQLNDIELISHLNEIFFQ